MSCERFETELADCIESGVDSDPQSPLGRHLATCTACRAGAEEARQGYLALAALPRLEAPEATSKRVRERIRRDLSATRQGLVRSPTGTALVAGLAGVLATAASIALLSWRIDLAALSPATLVGGSVVWAAAFVVAFALLLQAGSRVGSLREIVVCGLGALGAFLVIDSLLPLTRAVSFCRTSPLAQGLLGPVGPEALFFGLGSAYAALPVFVLSIAIGHGPERPILRRGLLAAGMFFFLVAPAIFLQCHAFAVGALVGWLAGAGVGSIAGSTAGYWVRRHGLVPVHR